MQERYKEAVSACDDGASPSLSAPPCPLAAHAPLVPAALEDKADYAKAIHRRALANEAIGSWGSLTASLEGAPASCSPARAREADGADTSRRTDFNKLANLPGNSPILVKQIKVAQARLPKKIEDQQAKEKDEVVGKLKDLGNMVLGASTSPRLLLVHVHKADAVVPLRAGKFGLSTDNFKLQEQPGGGYGISFER